MPPSRRREEVGASATSVRVRSILRSKHCGLCKSLEHRTCDYEERGAEKNAMLAKMNVSTDSKVGQTTALAGAAHGGGQEEWESNSGATFYMPHTRAEITA